MRARSVAISPPPGPSMFPRLRGRRVVAGAVTLALGSLIALAAAAAAGATPVTATATISPGGLAVSSAPAPPSFDVRSDDGAVVPSVAAQTLIVADATGSGWYITATSTTFTTGTRSLPNAATTLASAPTVNCAPGVTCEPAVDRVTLPYVLPSASTAPTATPLFDAAVGTGIGTQAVTAIWHVTVPAHMAGGTYRSTWVLSLVSAP